jgi:hypothetical protein
MSETVAKVLAAIIAIILMGIMVLGGMMLLIWMAIQLGLLVR